MKPSNSVPIEECGEPLVPIPLAQFAVESPHPYEKLGAPYGDKSPYYLRRTVLDCLLVAQADLQRRCPGWRIQIFDAYRPIAVQQFMVDYSLAELARSQTLDPTALTEDQRAALLAEVYEFWARPSPDPATPPPHSTGAAVDITLVDEQGQPVDMGSPIDELSVRSHSNHFAQSLDPAEQHYHQQRQRLNDIMSAAGFCRNPTEWWHFSLGDRFWARMNHQANPDCAAIARYGRVEE